jgi:hypothetical protein
VFLVVVSLILGGAIGLRFGMLALLPPLCAVICVHAVAFYEVSLGQVASAVLCIVSLQGGYMIGLTARDLLWQAVSRVSASFRSI